MFVICGLYAGSRYDCKLDYISNYLLWAYVEHSSLPALVHNLRPQEDAAVGYDFSYITIDRGIWIFESLLFTSHLTIKNQSAACRHESAPRIGEFSRISYLTSLD